MSMLDDFLSEMQRSTNKAQTAPDLNTDLDSLLDHVAYTIPALHTGDVLTLQPGIYSWSTPVVFVRYLLPSDKGPTVSGKLITTEDEDILVLLGLTRDVAALGVYATINSRLIIKVNGHDITKA